MAHHLYTAADADEIARCLKEIDRQHQRLLGPPAADPSGRWLLVAIDQQPRRSDNIERRNDTVRPPRTGDRG